MARNLLEKLSRQIQVMEKLAAVSDENIGNISSVIEGKQLPLPPLCVTLLPATAQCFVRKTENSSWTRQYSPILVGPLNQISRYTALPRVSTTQDRHQSEQKQPPGSR